jgi:hypothetical protein
MMAMMMMNQASDRDERCQEREERLTEFHLQMEMQRQQMLQQQNMMTILLMNAVGKSNCQQRQLGFSSNSTNTITSY